jgi:hypothetical protein
MAVCFIGSSVDSSVPFISDGYVSQLLKGRQQNPWSPSNMAEDSEAMGRRRKVGRSSSEPFNKCSRAKWSSSRRLDCEKNDFDAVEGVFIFNVSSEAAPSAEAFYEGASICAKSLLYAVHQLEQLRINHTE